MDIEKIKKTIEDIINNLAEESISLSQSLLKTKILASRLANEELGKWVINEINGYEDIDDLPDYRKDYEFHILSDYYLNGVIQQNMQIPLYFVKDLYQIDLYTCNFTESVVVLESYKEDLNAGKEIFQPIKIDLISLIQKYLVGKEHNKTLQIKLINQHIYKGDVITVLINIKTHLLDFMLALESKLGFISEIRDVSEKNKIVTKIFNTTILTSGNNNNINTGDHNQLS